MFYIIKEICNMKKIEKLCLSSILFTTIKIILLVMKELNC